MDVPNHDTDFFEWTQQQSAALRSCSLNCSELDTANLAEEIEDMGLEQVRKTSSFLVQMLVNLLKIYLEPSAPSAQNWLEQVLRFQADAVLTLLPNVKQHLDLEKIWRLAKKGATSKLAHYEVSLLGLPDESPLSLDTMLDIDFDVNSALEVITATVTSTLGSNR
jgi:hypothetical protein